MPSPKDTSGPIVKDGPNKGKNRARNDNGQWRKKRDDTGASRNKKKGSCFITTVVCDSRGMPDDCQELTVLRSFRDNYLLKTSEGKALVEKYYCEAPSISKKLTDPEDLQYAWVSIQRCLFLIQSNAMDEAVDAYKNMVNELSRRVNLEYL